MPYFTLIKIQMLSVRGVTIRHKCIAIYCDMLVVYCNIYHDILQNLGTPFMINCKACNTLFIMHSATFIIRPLNHTNTSYLKKLTKNASKSIKIHAMIKKSITHRQLSLMSREILFFIKAVNWLVINNEPIMSRERNAHSTFDFR